MLTSMHSDVGQNSSKEVSSSVEKEMAVFQLNLSAEFDYGELIQSKMLLEDDQYSRTEGI